MTEHADVFDYREPWSVPLTLSALLHGVAIAGILFAGVFSGKNEGWGGTEVSDGAINATLVSSAVPLPSVDTENENVLATESPGLSESQPLPPKPEEEAIPIPDRLPKIKPELAPRTPTREKPKAIEQPSNVVPYGQGGPARGFYTMVKTDTGSGGMSFDGGGSFGSRYSWYVDAVRRKISENWLKYEVDPSVTSAQRVYLTFEIARNGQPANIQVSQSSGVPSLDQSAVRALRRIDTFGPLPADYSGSNVSVEFWFDYKR